MVDVDARQRARRYAQERGLGCMANDTKWREFFALIIPAHIPTAIKFVDWPEVFECKWLIVPTGDYIEAGATGPRLFVFIEWISTDVTEPMRNAAAKVGLECFVQDGKATVYGYR